MFSRFHRSVLLLMAVLLCVAALLFVAAVAVGAAVSAAVGAAVMVLLLVGWGHNTAKRLCSNPVLARSLQLRRDSRPRVNVAGTTHGFPLLHGSCPFPSQGAPAVISGTLHQLVTESDCTWERQLKQDYAVVLVHLAKAVSIEWQVPIKSGGGPKVSSNAQAPDRRPRFVRGCSPHAPC